MKLLVLGGTRFVGRALTELALSVGHEVCLFHRGQSGAELFPEAEHVLGDRDGGLDVLGARRFDAVVDTCGYVPRIVNQSVSFCANKAEQYLFISTVSVYAEGPAELVESSPLQRFETEPEDEAITPQSYGPFKVQCEEEVSKFPGRVTQVRPGYIIGPWDTTDRYTYWADRLSKPQPCIIPAPASKVHQGVDVRDLGAFTLRLLETGTAGVFNVASPVGGLPFHQWLDATDEVCGRIAQKTLVDEAWLLEQGVQPHKDLPMWNPSDSKDGLRVTNVDAALEAGLQLRPISETLRDLVDWHRSRGEVKLKAGMTRERELELLAKLQA